MFRLLTTIILLVFASSPAWAACKGKDIKGLYLAYAAGSVGKNFVASVCGLRIASNGTIESGSSCVSDSANGVTGGNLRVTRDCTVTGVIKTEDGDIRIPLASMDRNKNTITGAYLVRRGQGTFTAVKHQRISGASPSIARYFGE